MSSILSITEETISSIQWNYTVLLSLVLCHSVLQHKLYRWVRILYVQTYTISTDLSMFSSLFDLCVGRIEDGVDYTTIPRNIQKLRIKYTTLFCDDAARLPRSLTSLQLSKYQDVDSLLFNELPNTLTHLGASVIDGQISDNILSIECNYLYKNIILPSNLQRLRISNILLSPVVHVPPTVTDIDWYDNDNLLSCQLQRLYLSYPIDSSVLLQHPSLTELTMKHDWIQEQWENPHFPLSLRTLSVPNCHISLIPKTVTNLSLQHTNLIRNPRPMRHSSDISDPLDLTDFNLSTLSINIPVKSLLLPQNITNLSLVLNTKLHMDIRLILPRHLTKLHVTTPENYNAHTYFPSHTVPMLQELTYSSIPSPFTCTVDSEYIPRSITKLSTYIKSNSTLPSSLLSNLPKLPPLTSNLTVSWYNTDGGDFPNTVTKLSIMYHKIVKFSHIPPKLVKLHANIKVHPELILPSNLTCLELQSGVNHKKVPKKFPPNLTRLQGILYEILPYEVRQKLVVCVATETRVGLLLRRHQKIDKDIQEGRIKQI